MPDITRERAIELRGEMPSVPKAVGHLVQANSPSGAEALAQAPAVIDYWRGVAERLDAEPCQWTPDTDVVWYTTCGGAFHLEAGGPDYNDMRFCPYCGKRLQEVPRG